MSRRTACPRRCRRRHCSRKSRRPWVPATICDRPTRWLVRDHAFVRTSSIDSFVATKRLARTKRATLDYLGVGDPDLSSSKAGNLGALPELPETSEEIERVANLFAKEKVRVLRREAATEEAFRLQPLSEFDVVHLATHGLVKEELPGLPEPSLVFTPAPKGDAFNDGLLTGSQIAALPLRARLVILSACNSARYEPSIIDSGIQGLSTSFAVAGVPSMIASLWPIESSLTRTLIIDVFRTAREGDNVGIADALAQAVRKHLDGPAPRPLLHPRFWAALVVLGDGAMTLEAAPTDKPRDLGPFAAIDPSQDEEILSAAPLDGDVVTSTIGSWNGKRSPSLIRRQAIDGTVRWEVSDGEIGAGLTAATGRMIYAAGYLAFPQANSFRSVPVLRGFGPNGKVLWSHRLPGGPQSTMIMGLGRCSGSIRSGAGRSHLRRRSRGGFVAAPNRQHGFGNGAPAHLADGRRAIAAFRLSEDRRGYRSRHRQSRSTPAGTRQALRRFRRSRILPSGK